MIGDRPLLDDESTKRCTASCYPGSIRVERVATENFITDRKNCDAILVHAIAKRNARREISRHRRALRRSIVERVLYALTD